MDFFVFIFLKYESNQNNLTLNQSTLSTERHFNTIVIQKVELLQLALKAVLSILFLHVFLIIVCLF